MKFHNLIGLMCLPLFLVGCSTFNHQTKENKPHAIFVIQSISEFDSVCKIDGKRVSDTSMGKPIRVRVDEHEIIFFHKRGRDESSLGPNFYSNRNPLWSQDYNNFTTFYSTNTISVDEGETYILDSSITKKQ